MNEEYSYVGDVITYLCEGTDRNISIWKQLELQEFIFLDLYFIDEETGLKKLRFHQTQIFEHPGQCFFSNITYSLSKSHW